MYCGGKGIRSSGWDEMGLTWGIEFEQPLVIPWCQHFFFLLIVINSDNNRRLCSLLTLHITHSTSPCFHNEATLFIIHDWELFFWKNILCLRSKIFLEAVEGRIHLCLNGPPQGCKRVNIINLYIGHSNGIGLAISSKQIMHYYHFATMIHFYTEKTVSSAKHWTTIICRRCQKSIRWFFLFTSKIDIYL